MFQVGFDDKAANNAKILTNINQPGSKIPSMEFQPNVKPYNFFYEIAYFEKRKVG
jgi:hypothetical protein